MPPAGDVRWQVRTSVPSRSLPHQHYDAQRHDYADLMPAVRRVVFTHGSWLNAWLHVPAGTTVLAATNWPPAPQHMRRVRRAA